MHHAFLFISLLSLHERPKDALFHVLWRTGIQDKDFLFLFLNIDTVLENLHPEKIANN